MTFGNKLQALRTGAGLSQEALAARLNVSRQAVSKWELGKTVPEVKYIVAISKLFSVTTDYLLKEEESVPPPPMECPPLEPAVNALNGERTTGHIPTVLLTCGNLLFLTLLFLYLFFYCFGFERMGIWPILLILLLGPILLAVSSALLGKGSVARVELISYRRHFTACVMLLGFGIAQLLGFSEVIDDLLVSQVAGAFSIPSFLVVLATLLMPLWLAGQLLGRYLTKNPEET